jgi:hypothetical protein
MGQGFLFKGKVLCEECYLKAEDYEIHAGRQAPPRKLMEWETCHDCGAVLTDTTDG